MSEPTRPKVVLSISGIRRDTVPHAQRIVDVAREFGVHAGISLSVMGAPRKHAAENEGMWRLRDDEQALAFIHDCQSRDHEMLLAGLGPIGVSPKTQNKLTTRSIDKAEFRRLGAHESSLRISAAQRQLEALGLYPTAFTPTRWAASEPALAAATKNGFGVVAEAYSVRIALPREVTTLPDGATIVQTGSQRWATFPTRVLAIGDGFGGEKWWRRQVKNSAQRMAQQYRTVRLSVNAGKAHKAGAIADVREVIERLHSYGYIGGNYADFAAAVRVSEPSQSVA